MSFDYTSDITPPEMGTCVLCAALYHELDDALEQDDEDNACGAAAALNTHYADKDCPDAPTY